MKTAILALLLAFAACSLIDISKLGREEVFINLYKSARCSRPRVFRRKMSVKRARKYIGEYAGEIDGVKMCVRVPREDEESVLNDSAYNEANGDGLAEKVIQKLREKKARKSCCPPPFSDRDQEQTQQMVERP